MQAGAVEGEVQKQEFGLGAAADLMLYRIAIDSPRRTLLRLCPGKYPRGKKRVLLREVGEGGEGEGEGQQRQRGTSGTRNSGKGRNNRCHPVEGPSCLSE